jgi:hypothetical protein
MEREWGEAETTMHIPGVNGGENIKSNISAFCNSVVERTSAETSRSHPRFTPSTSRKEKKGWTGVGR